MDRHRRTGRTTKQLRAILHRKGHVIYVCPNAHFINYARDLLTSLCASANRQCKVLQRNQVQITPGHLFVRFTTSNNVDRLTRGFRQVHIVYDHYARQQEFQYTN